MVEDHICAINRLTTPNEQETHTDLLLLKFPANLCRAAYLLNRA
jgi:hypothetical protein